jgi:hypothetical protein
MRPLFAESAEMKRLQYYSTRARKDSLLSARTFFSEVLLYAMRGDRQSSDGRMESSGMLRRVALVITDVSEVFSASINILFLRSVHRLLVMAKVPSSSILDILMIEALSSSETSFLIRATRCNIPEDAILQRHRRENLKSYKTEKWCLLGCYAVWLL